MNDNFGNATKPNWKQFLIFAIKLEENALLKQNEEQEEIVRRLAIQNNNNPNERRNNNRIINQELRQIIARPLSSFVPVL